MPLSVNTLRGDDGNNQMIMAIEIERKFLVKGDFSKQVSKSERIMQGYICSQPGRTVRIRSPGGRRIPHDQRCIGREWVEPLRVRAEDTTRGCGRTVETLRTRYYRQSTQSGPCREAHLGSRRLPRRQRRTDLSGNRIGF